MDLFSKIGAKAGETFQTIKDSDATKKAKNYAEIPGLTVQIGKQESIIKKAYQELGEAYYNAHKDDSYDQNSDIMQTITQALEKIEKLKMEIELKKSYDPSKDNGADVASAEETAKAEVVIESTQVDVAGEEASETSEE